MHRDPTDSLFERPNVVYVGISHGHQLLRVAMAVLHNAHTGLPSFKLLEKKKNNKNQKQFSQIPQGALESSEILLVVCTECLHGRLCHLSSALFQAEEPQREWMHVGTRQREPCTPTQVPNSRSL